jgi:hypothetical protein
MLDSNKNIEKKLKTFKIYRNRLKRYINDVSENEIYAKQWSLDQMETPLPVNDVYQKMKSKNEVKSS